MIKQGLLEFDGHVTHANQGDLVLDSRGTGRLRPCGRVGV
jgi:hypothetical protein